MSDRCPLCDGVAHTRQHFERCPLPYEAWPAVQALKAELEALRNIIGMKLTDRLVAHGPGWFLADSAGRQRTRVTLMHEELRELERCKARIAELEESDVGRLCKTANAMIVERDHEIARLKAELAAVKSFNDVVVAENDAYAIIIDEVQKLMKHFNDKGLLVGNGEWRQRELYQHCKRIDDACEQASVMREKAEAEPRPEGDANE